jgi:excisionase family DNA binding protein
MSKPTQPHTRTPVLSGPVAVPRSVGQLGGNTMTNMTRKRPAKGTFDTVTPVLYRVEEAAEALRVSRGTLYGLIRSGQLDTVKVGSRRLVPVAALHEYVTALGSAA